MHTNTELTVAAAALARLNKSMSKTSLDDLVTAKTRRSLMLVDVSSSMHSPIRAGGRAIDALRKVVIDLRETHPVPVAAFGGRGVELVDDVPEPRGGTPMTEAIEFGTREGANHLVVVTDGEPNNAASAFEAARLFDGTIDTFYIGNGHDAGSRFCAELAKMTGGTANLTDLGQPKALSAKIAGLLCDGSGL